MDAYLESLVKIKKEEDAVAEPEVVEVEPEVVVEETKIEEPVKEEKKPAKKLTNPEPAEDKADLEIDRNYHAKTIRIFKTPDIHQVSTAYTGNVIYKGKIGEFDIIQYVKAGFGLVQGYTKDLKNSID